MLELLIIALALAFPYRMWRRRHERRQGRIDAAFNRARLVSLSGTGPTGRAPVYGERFYNPR